MTIPNNLFAPEINELVELALKIRDWQESQKLSDAEMIRRYRGLGSDKTYRRIRERDLDELDIEKQLASYRAVWALIESTNARTQNDEELFEDFTAVVHIRRAFTEIVDERSIRRVVLVEADSGLGKSTAITLLQRKYGQKILSIEPADVWSDNPNALYGAILEALGVKELPVSGVGRLDMCLRRLNQSRIVLAIDEAHDLGPRCLDSCKTLINKTPIVIMLFAWPTLWARLVRSSYQEVKQLMGNRLSERIKVGELRESDVKKLLSRRVKAEHTDSAKAVLEVAKLNGNLSFVAAVCERLTEQEIEGPVSHEHVLAALQAELARR